MEFCIVAYVSCNLFFIFYETPPYLPPHSPAVTPAALFHNRGPDGIGASTGSAVLQDCRVWELTSSLAFELTAG